MDDILISKESSGPLSKYYLERKRDMLLIQIKKAEAELVKLERQITGKVKADVEKIRIPRGVTNELIIQVVCDHYYIEWNKVYNLRHRRFYSDITHTIFYFIHKRGGMTMTQIGSILDKHHATVIHALKKVNNLLEVDKKYRSKIDEIAQDIIDRYEIEIKDYMDKERPSSSIG